MQRKKPVRRAEFEPLEDRRMLSAAYAANEVLVQFAANAAPAAMAAARAAVGGRAIEAIQTSAMRGAGSGVLERVALGRGVSVERAIAALANRPGVTGVSWNVTMISTKFLGSDGGYISSAIKSLDYLTDLKTRHGLNIVASNNSWGGGGYSSALHSAIIRGANAGILFVAAAGNSGLDTDVSANYPSNYSTLVGTSTTKAASYEAVISVAALTSSGSLASFSNYGATTVDLAAPGASINSTLPGNTYGSMSGTSMAAPHVSGAIALYAAAHPTASAAHVRSAMLGSTRATASLAGKTVTGGRLDVAAALNAVPPAPAPVPTLSINSVAALESVSRLTFTITLSAASASSVTVRFATANGTATAGTKGDYTATSGTLTFNPGETTKTISVSVRDDSTVEPDETFFVNLSSASGATIAVASGTGTILNDDTSSGGGGGGKTRPKARSLG